ncbi:hypothetical protein [Anaerotignum propionicum]|nr:hypothetical protein [Anaerotignum propionicum]
MMNRLSVQMMLLLLTIIALMEFISVSMINIAHGVSFPIDS